MSERLLDDLSRAAACVTRLAAVGARVKTALVSEHGATITLADPGDLMDHLDARQTPVVCAIQTYMAIVDGCLVSWPATAAGSPR